MKIASIVTFLILNFAWAQAPKQASSAAESKATKKVETSSAAAYSKTSSGDIKSSESEVMPAKTALDAKSATGETSSTTAESKPALDAPGASVGDTDSGYHFGGSLSFSPGLKRSSEVRYDHLTSSINKTTNHLDGFSLGVGLIYRTTSLYGWRALAGLEFEAPREVWFTDRAGQAHKFEATVTNAHLAIGYQFWRVYADIGMQFPLYSQKEWETFKVETVPGGKVNLGIEITSTMQLELFYRFHSYALTEKVPISSDPVIRIFNSSSGILLKLSDSRTK